VAFCEAKIAKCDGRAKFKADKFDSRFILRKFGPIKVPSGHYGIAPRETGFGQARLGEIKAVPKGREPS
jgi:hypothetical protein